MFSRPLLWLLLLLVALPEARAGESGGADVGTLQIVTSYWADVYVDGKRKGRAPLRSITLPAGSHTVRLLGNPSVRSYQREVIIRAGERTVLRVNPESPPDSSPVEPSGMEPPRPRATSTGKSKAEESKPAGTGALHIVTRYWADVYVDGKRRGRAPLRPITLPVGRHVVELRGNAAFEPYRQEIVIREGQTLELAPEPKPVD